MTLNPRFILFSSFLAVALFIYLFPYHRYNGWDYTIYLDALSRLNANHSPYRYDDPMSYRYMPPTLFFYKGMSIFSEKYQHWLMVFLSFICLMRAIWLGRPYILLPILLLHQGLSAQFESGNINWVLIYLSLEGLWQYQQNKKSLGLVLMCIPAFFKLQMGLMPYFIFIKDFPQNKKSALIPLLACLAIFFSMDISLYKDWWYSNHAHSSAMINKVSVAVNNSLFSFFHHVLNISINKLWLLLATLWGLLHFILKLKISPMQTYSIVSLFVYLFFPATFPYSILMLYVPVLFLLELLSQPQNQITKICCYLFLFGIVIFNPNIWGKELFNSIVVYYRLSSWFLLPYFILISTQEFTFTNPLKTPKSTAYA